MTRDGLNAILNDGDLLSKFHSAKRAIFIFLDPFVDAMKMEVVIAFTLDRRAFISSELASGARQVKLIVANTATFHIDIPLPGCSRDPFVYLNSHVYSIQI